MYIGPVSNPVAGGGRDIEFASIATSNNFILISII